MKHKLISAIVFILVLLAIPLTSRSQENSRLIVETLRSTVPTTVRSGEPFSQTYRIKFLDSPDGKEVIILENEMTADKIPVSSEFEVLGRTLEKRKDGDENVWDLTYTFRVISPKKGPKKIPKFVIRWAIKEPGKSNEEAKEQTHIETSEVLINYVPTTTADPYLDIRDKLDFGSYQGLVALLWWLPLLSPAVLLAMAYLFVRSLRRSRRKAITKPTSEIIMTDNDSAEEFEAKPLTLRQAYLSLLKTADSLVFAGAENGQSIVAAEKKLFDAGRVFILAIYPEINIGNTPREMKSDIVRTLKAGSRRDLLVALVSRLEVYYNDRESGKSSIGGDGELGAERNLVRRIARRLYWRRWRPL